MAITRFVYGTFCVLLACKLLPISACGASQPSEQGNATNGTLASDVHDLAQDTLRSALRHENGWTKVHAAENLLDLGMPLGALEEFEQELKIGGDQPITRIGVWRVLAKAAQQPREREEFTSKLAEVARNPEASDRVHAAETLAKLGVVVNESVARDIGKWVASSPDSDAAFGHWLLAQSATEPQIATEHEARLVTMLGSKNPLARLRAAYAISRMSPISKRAKSALIAAAEHAATQLDSDQEIEQLAAAHAILGAWRVASEENDNARAIELHVTLKARASTSKSIAPIFADALAEFGTPDDAQLLANWLTDSNADLRVRAANALLRIERRRPRHLVALDWIVLFAYGIVVILIGVAYSRRIKSTDDYLLGGRHMRPWMVGFSLFATLLSTLTYLAIPGEMIKHGPMMLAGIAAFPFVAWIVGWSMIPYFMRLKATTAYEILEGRFGTGGRTLGSAMFLSLRFVWMAVIIYKTTEIVLLPIVGWSATAVPWVCMVLGIITVVYSSLGGFRAVVLTDVVQTLILLSGVVLSILVITVQLGGFSQWWPTKWDPQWTPLEFWFEPGSPRTIAAVVMSQFLWFICTSGSDQMAVQRYLATTDAQAARRMFILSLVVTAVCTVFLSILGFALLAFYRQNPELLADGNTIASAADMLFPRFVVTGLPAGLSGLVVAALLAAAMSSLSSGINASCSIISVDYVDRWRRTQRSEKSHLRQTTLISWGVGAIVVLLSLLVGQVEGNLIDVMYKLVNLLVAPLFVLFFMAMYVPRATWPTTFLAVLLSVVAAVAVAFFEIGGLSVLWIMPVSLVVGITAGWLGSLCTARNQ